MSKYFNTGDRVFFTTGVGVLEGTVAGRKYGRYIVSFKGDSSEPLGIICISENRLFRTRDEANANVGVHSPTVGLHSPTVGLRSPTVEAKAPSQMERRTYRAAQPDEPYRALGSYDMPYDRLSRAGQPDDEPYDGWAVW